MRMTLRSVSPLDRVRRLREMDAIFTRVRNNTIRLDRIEHKLIEAKSPFGWGKQNIKEIQDVNRLEQICRALIGTRKTPQSS